MNELFNLRPDLTCYAKFAVHKVGYVAGQVEITSACSQRCIACDSWRAHTKGTIKGTLSLLALKDLVSQLNAMQTFEHLSFTGGDPQDWCAPEYPDFNFENLLILLNMQGLNFSLQVNTALIKPIVAGVWRKSLNRVRVSLDGIKRETYKKLRGDDRDPEEIIERMEELAHPGLATITCVSDGNIDEIPAIIERLNRMKNPPRKAMFLAVLNVRIKEDFWDKYDELKEVPSPKVQTSFQEDVIAVRCFCNSLEAEQLPCVVGGITFHIKCNGDVYPCCLIGGEAVKTQEHMKIGNIDRDELKWIQNRYRAKYFYKKGTPCSEVCQWKQLQINKLAQAAKDITLTMP